MSSYMLQSSKVDLTPRRYHGYAVVLFIMGALLPPLAVAARFGFNRDFWINIVLTLCGYIPGHGHNFYIQNIRNNKNHRRTPKWAQRYGLVDTAEIKRKERKSQWASRYAERNPTSALDGAEYADGQVPNSSRDNSINGAQQGDRQRDGLWRDDDAQYYGPNGDSRSSRSVDSGGGGRWHYPANFDDTLPPLDGGSSGKKKKKVKKDRWARTEDAYAAPDSGSRRKKKKKARSSVGTGEDDTFDRRSDTTMDVPEDPGRGAYGDNLRDNDPTPPAVGSRQRDVLDHEF